MIKITIPCHTYIRKFVQSHYPAATGNLPLTRHSFIGAVIFTMLEKTARPYEPGEYQDQVVFEINEFYFERFGATVSPAQVHQFNEVMDNIFREGMFRSIDMATTITSDHRRWTHENKLTKDQKHYRRKYLIVQTPPDINHCIVFYCRMFGIDENDIMMETLKKSYYRYRKAYNRKSRVFC